MGRPALKQEVSRDPLRDALADAILALASKRAERDAVQAAYNRASDIVTDSFGALEAVEAEIQQAGFRHRDEIVASVLRGDEKLGNSRREEAERRKTEIEERAASAREARDILKSAVEAENERVHRAELDVRECRDAIVFEGLPALVRAAADLRQQFKAAALLAILVRKMQPRHLSADDPRRALGDAADRVTAPVFLAEAGKSPDPAYAAWEAVAESLLIDPDALLPGAPVPLSNAA